jgi:hypothetical protein
VRSTEQKVRCRVVRPYLWVALLSVMVCLSGFLSGVFRHAAQQDYFDSGRANPLRIAEIPASAPDGSEGLAYSLEEIKQMLKILSEPAYTVVATAAYTGLRLGKLRGLVWESCVPATDRDSLGLLYVRRSVWRSFVGDPKTEKSKAPVPVIPQLATGCLRKGPG